MGFTIRKRFLAALLMAALLPAPAPARAAEPAHRKHIDQAVHLLQEMQDQPDAESLGQAVASCKAVAIFPSMIEAALGVVGSMHGEGVVMLRNPKGGWNGPSFASLIGGMAGLQLGVKSVGLVLVITNEEGLSAFTGGNTFKLGGDVSVAAGPVGRDAEAATDSTLKASIYSYSISKGLFAGVSLSGSTINVNRDATKAYWGKDTEAKEALSKPATDPRIAPLAQELDNLSKLAK